jgi:PAS domain S-box-containing protein
MSNSTRSQFDTEETKERAASDLNLLSAGSALAEMAAAFLSDISSSRKRQPPTQSAGSKQATPPSAQARYQVLVEQIPAVVFMAYLDGGMGEAYVSPHIEQTLGFSQEEWLDDPLRWYQQIHPDDRSRWSIEAAETLITGRPLKSIYRVLAADGRVVWFHCEAKLVRRENGEPWFIHGVGFDITELKQTEQALKQESAERERLQKLALEHQIAKAEQTESRLAAIVESSEDPIIGKTLDGTVTTWNAAASRVFGYQPEEIVGKSILLLVPPERYDEERELLSRLRAGARIAHQETQRVTKDGVRIDVSLTISPIKIGSNIIGASTIARDITERKRAEEALRESEERFRTMAETAADAIFRIDQRSTILFANRAAEKIFGYTSEELIGQTLTILMPEYLREIHRNALERYVRTGVRHLDWGRVEVAGLHKEGRELTLELSLGESGKDGTRLFTGFVRDITERKQIEEKLRMTEKLAATGRLAATIAHEINNPLEAVTNLLYLARKDSSSSPKLKQYLKVADEELDRVAHLAKQTLGFYRDTSSPAAFDPALAINDVTAMYSRRAFSRNVAVEIKLEPGIQAFGFVGEFRQVLSNLISNALDAMGETGGRLLIRAHGSRALSNGAERLRVIVADTGPGIPPESRKKLFEAFFTTKSHFGTGLGLWLSLSIIQKHGGAIRFRSSIAPGKSGTVVSFLWPVAEQNLAQDNSAA